MAAQKLTYNELVAENEKLLTENKKLKEANEAAYATIQDCKETLLRARAQLQLYKEVAKTHYFTTLNLKEI